MPSLKAIRTRIASVKNTQKITKAMKLALDRGRSRPLFVEQSSTNSPHRAFLARVLVVADSLGLRSAVN